MKKYRIIDNTLGWLMFLVAAITYCLTIEPTASFWDCPEFIAQAFKSEVGHPPGNPIFILLGRFAANFAGGDVMAVSKCVNIMSALLSAGTILFLFWTITHLVKKLVVKDSETETMTLTQYLVVMGSGVCGALAYTWSDTFWFSAVEAEVYAFSSFCTALVFWLILKWEDQADDPSSDRWIVLIAYVFGFSLGVHLLNLLCIPAIALVVYYRKWSNTDAKGSLIALALSCAVIVLILYGLEPGIVEMGGYFDRFFVNVLGCPFNTGVVFYVIAAFAVMGWAIWEHYKAASDMRMRLSFFSSVIITGMLMIGDGIVLPLLLIVALGVYLFRFLPKVPRRLFSNVLISMLMIFVGFSCYALIIIRSNANTTLDENSPSTMDELTSYLSREQYGKTPLLWGPVYTATMPQYESNDNGQASTRFKEGRVQYARQVKENPSDPDRYVKTGHVRDVVYPSEMNMLFPRIWSPQHAEYYNSFFDVENNPFDQTLCSVVVDKNGNLDTRFGGAQQLMPKPSFKDNLEFFVGYQLNYMYMRYFLWNFAGRQNDIQGLYGEVGDVTRGNWISGIPVLDNARLGDQSLLPAGYGDDNPGHNVFYCLPLLLGIIGLLWQAFAGKRGIEQFWVIFFLFFMTGIAIVLYLNQPPLQPRERDYAYAGSFYAFAIWIGMGVAGLWRLGVLGLSRLSRSAATKKQSPVCNAETSKPAMAIAVVTCLIGLAVPLQMVSQTWDDHDRSGRYCARDFGMNYLSSLDENAIIFTNGDNDTFPLWYLQEVEDFRTDVRVVNLSYLATDWYIEQLQRASYKAAPVPMQAGKLTYAYGNRQGVSFEEEGGNPMSVATATNALKYVYDDKNFEKDEDCPLRVKATMRHLYPYIPVDADQAIKAGVVPQRMRDNIVHDIEINFGDTHQGYVNTSDLMALDIINASYMGGCKRPVYFACTVDSRLYMPYSSYLLNTGMAYQVTPVLGAPTGADQPMCNTDKMYENVTKKFRWGGLDSPQGRAGKIYLDETVRRMVNTTRMMVCALADDLTIEAQQALTCYTSTLGNMTTEEFVADRVAKAVKVLNLIQDKITEKACPYVVNNRIQMARTYNRLYQLTGDKKYLQKAITLVEADVLQFATATRFSQMLQSQNAKLSTDKLTHYLAYGYVPENIVFYEKIAGKEACDKLLKKLDGMGVNTTDLHSYILGFKKKMMEDEQRAKQGELVME